ncbi:MAG: ATP-binding cassette domain-containing protein [Anaerolineae bacterium]|nr:ATP-binding cassette domain-containing protein [Anaerolineae bacterium]
MSLLTVQGYTKRFTIHHLNREIAVFENLEFTVAPGQFTLVVGPNGAGKSTLLRCLYRTYLPTAGSAVYASQYGDIDLATAADVDISVLRNTEIGFVTQFLRPRPRISALELVAEPLIGSGIAWNDALQQAEAMLTLFNLKPELWHAYPTTFSGGEQQKVNLSRALIRPRRLLLLDEPTASLDVPTRTALVSRLAELKAQGVAMIGIFHHAEDVTALVDSNIYISAAVDASLAREIENVVE